MNIWPVLKANARVIKLAIGKESPTILTTLGVGGLITTVVLAVKGTPKALYIIDRETHLRGAPLKKMEVVKLTWKCYAPAALVGATTIGCIVGANSINLRRNAALASLYTITERSLKEYQAKVVETIGKNKEGKILDEIAQEKLDRDPIDKKEVIVTGKGESLFYEGLSGRYFKTDMEAIRRAVNDFNHEMLTQDTFKPLNDFYDMIGLEQTDLGRDNGWDIERLLEIRYSAKLVKNTGQACVVLEFTTGPKPL